MLVCVVDDKLLELLKNLPKGYEDVGTMANSSDLSFFKSGIALHINVRTDMRTNM